MYNIKLTDYPTAPSPAAQKTPGMIVAAHYYAAWKKGAALLHEGFDDLHDWPERTPLMGYYDEENPEVCDWEIKWAVEHGINCFIYCWYRLKENYGKPITQDALRCGHGIHEALFHAKFAPYMKFAIMYEASPRWCGTDEKDIVENLMPFWTENYFKRENYLVIDGKPVIFVYNQKRLANECFADVSSQARAFERCREYAVKAGFSGLIFAAESWQTEKQYYDELRARGYDFSFGYSAYYKPSAPEPTDAEITAGQLARLDKYLSLDPMRVATASCFRDSTPRLSQKWVELGTKYAEWDPYPWYLSPEGYRDCIFAMTKRLEKLPEGSWGKRLFMIDNWNEWDEGHFVAPSVSFGFRYLEAIRASLTCCDNLPDYRMPQDIGFTGLGKSWKEPDLASVCRKKFSLK